LKKKKQKNFWPKGGGVLPALPNPHATRQIEQLELQLEEQLGSQRILVAFIATNGI
jgi:hypothetical protein